jgi:hypothetical protein
MLRLKDNFKKSHFYLKHFIKNFETETSSIIFIFVMIEFQEWCQVLQTHHMQDQIGEMQRQSVAAAQAKTMVSI